VLPLDSLAARAVASVRGGSVESIGFPRTPDAAFDFGIAHDSTARDIAVNPYTGDALGAYPGPTSLQQAMRSIHQFHTGLLAGDAGHAVVDFVTLGSLLLVITGVVIWWRERRWRIQWSASWKRVVFDLHHALGVLAALVLLAITGTGVWMGFPNQVTPLVMKMDRTPPPAGQPRQPARDSGSVPLSPGALATIAMAAVPGAPILVMRMPAGGPVLVTLRYPEDRTPGGRSRVWIDHYRGTVLRVQNTRQLGPGSKLLTLQRPLHTGDMLGVPGQVIWFLSALILASQAITGALMWWNGRAKGKPRRQVPRQVPTRVSSTVGRRRVTRR